MIFLVVLLVATAAVAAGSRLRRRGTVRDTARVGFGVALAVAGVTHFVTPTPFEQHVPGWVPLGPAVVVAVSGAVEIALGLALVLARRWRRWTAAATAAFLVLVFPANVYVAVAGIEVDGQPGGAYPWIRLPLQALFVAWVLWSAAGPTQRSSSPTAYSSAST